VPLQLGDLDSGNAHEENQSLSGVNHVLQTFVTVVGAFRNANSVCVEWICSITFCLCQNNLVTVYLDRNASNLERDPQAINPAFDCPKAQQAASRALGESVKFSRYLDQYPRGFHEYSEPSLCLTVGTQ
jgi:hypothetical protein